LALTVKVQTLPELQFKPDRTMQELVEVSAFHVGLPARIKPE
jgi:ribosome-binding factor A